MKDPVPQQPQQPRPPKRLASSGGGYHTTNPRNPQPSSVNGKGGADGKEVSSASSHKKAYFLGENGTDNVSSNDRARLSLPNTVPCSDSTFPNADNVGLNGTVGKSSSFFTNMKNKGSSITISDSANPCINQNNNKTIPTVSTLRQSSVDHNHSLVSGESELPSTFQATPNASAGTQSGPLLITQEQYLGMVRPYPSAPPDSAAACNMLVYPNCPACFVESVAIPDGATNITNGYDGSQNKSLLNWIMPQGAPGPNSFNGSLINPQTMIFPMILPTTPHVGPYLPQLPIQSVETTVTNNFMSHVPTLRFENPSDGSGAESASGNNNSLLETGANRRQPFPNPSANQQASVFYCANGTSQQAFYAANSPPQYNNDKGTDINAGFPNDGMVADRKLPSATGGPGIICSGPLQTTGPVPSEVLGDDNETPTNIDEIGSNYDCTQPFQPFPAHLTAAPPLMYYYYSPALPNPFISQNGGGGGGVLPFDHNIGPGSNATTPTAYLAQILPPNIPPNFIPFQYYGYNTPHLVVTTPTSPPPLPPGQHQMQFLPPPIPSALMINPNTDEMQNVHLQHGKQLSFLGGFQQHGEDENDTAFPSHFLYPSFGFYQDELKIYSEDYNNPMTPNNMVSDYGIEASRYEASRSTRHDRPDHPGGYFRGSSPLKKHNRYHPKYHHRKTVSNTI